ncbi:PKD domain-containing protein [Hymenobacter siberiensis]|uniref:PKD domain-containing protein n=1 Tax=Hymenobacter siberiensis TaxID=2848396 RepID=UPI001C1E7F23|nr:PKD domain-containing protein [Hymenobacter siberiensis]MBU6120188.1 PKD domain-containing protein [Hymenobacter siberiensis]
MRFSLAVISAKASLLAALLMLVGFAAQAQQAGDTTSISCGPPLPRMLCVDLDGRPSIDEPAGPFTYQWHMGDGTTLTGPTVSYCYKERKNYVVELDVIVDKTGEIRRGQKYIPVNLVQQNIIDFTTTTTRVRVGQPVSFDSPEAQLITCRNVQYVWDFRDGTIMQGRTAQHSFRRPGTYSVRFSMRGYGSQDCVASHCVSREIVVEP